MINIDNSDDKNYRYQMPKVLLTFEGKGNGVFTIINNMSEIAKAVNTPDEIIFKFISYTLGVSYNKQKKSITGHHLNLSIQTLIYDYINKFVICQTCKIPELDYLVNKINSKNYNLTCKCSACGVESNIENPDNVMIKCISLITNFIIDNKVWIKDNGMRVHKLN